MPDAKFHVPCAASATRPCPTCSAATRPGQQPAGTAAQREAARVEAGAWLLGYVSAVGGQPFMPPR